MLKKIIIVAIIAAAGYFVVIVIPRMIEDKKIEEQQKTAAKETLAEKKAAELLSDKIGITGGNAGFGGKFSEKARDNAAKATNRSNDYLDQMEDE